MLSVSHVCVCVCVYLIGVAAICVVCAKNTFTQQQCTPVVYTHTHTHTHTHTNKRVPQTAPPSTYSSLLCHLFKGSLSLHCIFQRLSYVCVLTGQPISLILKPLQYLCKDKQDNECFLDIAVDIEMTASI